MSRRPRLGDVVEIHWRDSQSIDLGWRPRSEYLGTVRAPQAYRTAGYWLGRVAGMVTVVASVDPANQAVANAWTIPAVAIDRIRVLGRARRRTRRALKR